MKKSKLFISLLILMFTAIFMISNISYATAGLIVDNLTAERIIVRARLDAVATKVPVRALKEKLTAFIEETFSDEHAD